jgi:gliding motility-associated-like protein
VKVSDNSGCSAYAKVDIVLRDSILKAAISGPEFVCPEDFIVFKDTSIGKITNWYWNFGNGSTSTLQNPPAQHFPPNNAFFSVNLSIVDSSGCEQSVKKTIRSVNNCFIAVPNAFTPNGDGLNDFLYPLNAYKATNLVFKVFDRWGRLVFETKDWTRKWDGKLNGSPQAPGVYVWILSYTDDHAKPVFMKGTVALIR